MVKQRLLSIYMLLVIVLSSCSNNAHATVTPAQPLYTQTHTPIPSTLTAYPTETLIPTPTPLPSPTPRPEVDQAFIDTISHKCAEGFSSRLTGDEARGSVLTIWRVKGEWYESFFKVPFAETKYRDEIKFLVCIDEIHRKVATYTDGMPAYQKQWKIRVVDYATGFAITEKSFYGGNPPEYKPSGMDMGYGDDPDKIAAFQWLFGLLNTPVLEHSAYVDSLAFSPDGLQLAVHAWHNDIRIWNLEKNKPTKLTSPNPEKSNSTNINYSPDGNVIAYSNGEKIIYKILKGNINPPDLGLTNITFARYVDFSPDGKSIALGGTEIIQDRPYGAIYIFDLSTGEVRVKIIRKMEDLPDYSDYALDWLCYSPDGQFIASSGQINSNGYYMVHSTQDGSLLFSYNTGYFEGSTYNPSPRGITFSPDSKLLAIGSIKGNVIIYQTGGWRELATLEGPINVIFTISFSPNGELLASGGVDEEIFLWRVKDWTLVDRLTGHADEVTALAFSPNGLTLASGSRDTTVYLWDVAKYY